MDFVKDLFGITKSVQDIVDECFLPPVEINPSDKHIVLPQVLFDHTRGYLEKIAYQINTTYENTCYDACSVMIRRLIEILIIEVYESHAIEYKIKDDKGEFLFLEDLINKSLSETTWNIGRNTKKCLRSSKCLGDLSAHSRRYNTNRNDLDKVIGDLRVAAEELMYLAGLKK